jgi:hypothetical protein
MHIPLVSSVICPEQVIMTPARSFLSWSKNFRPFFGNRLRYSTKEITTSFKSRFGGEVVK